MNPILKIVKYLFEKNNIDVKVDDFNSFFIDGVSFPKFVSLALNVETIPNVISNPTTLIQLKNNNDFALQFLFDKNKDIANERPTFNSKNDQANLLSLILTKQCFKVNYEEILDKCNVILSKIGITITTKNEFINPKCIQMLLNVLTDGSVPIDDKTTDFDEMIIKCFKEAGNFKESKEDTENVKDKEDTENVPKYEIPLVIDKSSLEIQNEFTFLIQILIIFDCFSDKIDSIYESKGLKVKKEKKTKDSKKKNEEKNQDEKPKELKKKKGSGKKKETKKRKEIQKQKDSEKQKETVNDDNDNDDDIKIKDLEINDVENVDNIFDLSPDKKVKSKQNKDNTPFDELTDTPLLKTINAIAEDAGLHFNNFHQTIEKDNILKIVRILMKDSDDYNYVSKLIKAFKQPEYKIREIMKYIGQKEAVFNVLALDFKDKKFSLSSAALFYTNFLNLYFLKVNKLELFRRLSTIIFHQVTNDSFFYSIYMKNLENKKNPYDDLSILLRWDTYLALLDFLNTNKIHYEPDSSKNDEYYFKENHIPQIIDRKYLSNFTKRVPDAAFYQLQFIFNALDKKKFFSVLEILLKTERMIKEIKIPQYHTIAASIKSKYFSIIFQKENYEENRQKRKDREAKEKAKESKEPKEESENDQKSEIKKEKEVIEKPETFKQRVIKRTLHCSEKIKSKPISLSPYIKVSEFWNPANKNTMFDNGVLCTSKIDIPSNQEYFNDVSYYNYYCTPNQSNDKQETFIKDFPIKKDKPDLYKFFIYNESKNKWEINNGDINSFFSQKKYDSSNPIAPLILFLDSDENDVTSINSLFGGLSYTEIDPTIEDIFIYATGEINSRESKPIFLCLHVPQNKAEIDDIKSIIFKVYYFLSVISDIKIVILNKEHLLEQIELVKSIENIKRSYEISANRKLEIKSPTKKLETKSPTKKLETTNEKPQEITPKKIKKSNHDKDDDYDDDDDYDYSSDENDYINDNGEKEDYIINNIIYEEDQAKEEEEEQNENVLLLNTVVDEADLDVWKKNSRYIFLINEPTFIGDNNEPGENNLLNSIKEKVSNATIEFHHINSNDPITFRGFLTSLTNFSKEVPFKSEEVKKQLNLYPLTAISNKYIELKSKDEWKNELKETIYDRFSQLKDKDKGESSEFYILYKLDTELSKSYPSIDFDFNAECNKNINEINNSIVEKNQNTVISELEESSKNNLKYLSDIITSKSYFSEQEIDIETSHINFLKNEFFEIIHETFPRKDQIQAFEGNRKILENQIKKDFEKIKKIIADFENYVKSLKQQKTVSLNDKIQSGTNYTIRETENIREIQVLVQAGHLNDVIEQDF